MWVFKKYIFSQQLWTNLHFSSVMQSLMWRTPITKTVASHKIISIEPFPVQPERVSTFLEPLTMGRGCRKMLRVTYVSVASNIDLIILCFQLHSTMTPEQFRGLLKQWDRVGRSDLWVWMSICYRSALLFWIQNAEIFVAKPSSGLSGLTIRYQCSMFGHQYKLKTKGVQIPGVQKKLAQQILNEILAFCRIGVIFTWHDSKFGVTFGELFNEIHSQFYLWSTVKKSVKNGSFAMPYSLASEKFAHKSL